MSRNYKAAALNEWRGIGNLTREPELQYVQSGDAVCKFGMACTKKFKRKDGTTNESTVFLNVKVWRGVAEYVGQYLHKGDPVLVEGSLDMNEWEDKATGKKRSQIEIAGRVVQSLGYSEDGGNQSRGQQETRSSGGGHQQHGGQQAYESAPKPRKIEEPVPEDDIPF